MSAIVPSPFAIGDRVEVIGAETLVGTITAAPAPGMRRVRWDDGQSGDVDVRDIRPAGAR